MLWLPMTTISHTRLSFVVPLVGVCCLTLDGKTTLHFVSGNGRAAIVTAAKALFVSVRSCWVDDVHVIAILCKFILDLCLIGVRQSFASDRTL